MTITKDAFVELPAEKIALQRCVELKYLGTFSVPGATLLSEMWEVSTQAWVGVAAGKDALPQVRSVLLSGRDRKPLRAQQEKAADEVCAPGVGSLRCELCLPMRVVMCSTRTFLHCKAAVL